MDIEAVKRHCQQYPGATSALSGEPNNVLGYKIGRKTFAYFKTSDPEKWRFSFRTTPDRFVELTGVPGVKPARYMGRFHWVTIIDVRAFPADYLRELISWSYEQAYAGLSRELKRELSPAGIQE